MIEVDFEGKQGEFIKIGYVQSDEEQPALRRIRKRLVQLQSGNPRKLLVVGMCAGGDEREKELHNDFAQYRVARPTPSEWFALRGPVLTWLNRVRLDKPIATKDGTRLPHHWWRSWLGVWRRIGDDCLKRARRMRRARQVTPAPVVEPKPKRQFNPVDRMRPHWPRAWTDAYRRASASVMTHRTDKNGYSMHTFREEMRRRRAA